MIDFDALESKMVHKIDDQERPFEEISACFGCKYYSTEQEQDGWENPMYTVPCCDRPEGRGPRGTPRLFEDGSLIDWPIGYCRHRRVK